MPPSALPLAARWCAALLVTGTLLGAAAPSDPLERQPLFTPAELGLWTSAESSVQVSTQVTRDNPASLHWHVTVDHQTGEAKYPIGWPRVSRSIPAGPLRDWSRWDFLHCWVFVTTNRDTLPAIPVGLGLHAPDRSSAFQRTLSELKAGEWVEIKLPIAQIPRHHDVRQMQFHIAEANYHDGDRLDFFISDLALLRHAAPAILNFALESAVLFSDARQIPLRLHLAGLAVDARTQVVCELHRSGRVIIRRALPATRGVQTAVLELDAALLTAGEYELRAQFGGQPPPATARLRVVESPWK